jgi:hypothetical protein
MACCRIENLETVLHLCQKRRTHTHLHLETYKNNMIFFGSFGNKRKIYNNMFLQCSKQKVEKKGSLTLTYLHLFMQSKLGALKCDLLIFWLAHT